MPTSRTLFAHFVIKSFLVRCLLKLFVKEVQRCLEETKVVTPTNKNVKLNTLKKVTKRNRVAVRRAVPVAAKKEIRSHRKRAVRKAARRAARKRVARRRAKPRSQR